MLKIRHWGLKHALTWRWLRRRDGESTGDDENYLEYDECIFSQIRIVYANATASCPSGLGPLHSALIIKFASISGFNRPPEASSCSKHQKVGVDLGELGGAALDESRSLSVAIINYRVASARGYAARQGDPKAQDGVPFSKCCRSCSRNPPKVVISYLELLPRYCSRELHAMASMPRRDNPHAIFMLLDSDDR